MVVVFRLKELLLKERSECSNLHIRVEELEGRCQSLTQQLDQACSKEEQHKGTLRRLEERISQGDAIRSRQQDEEVLWLIYYASVECVNKKSRGGFIEYKYKTFTGM